MHFTAERVMEAPVDVVRALIQNPATWSFLPGAEEVVPAAHGGEVHLVLRGPRRMSVRLEFRETELGLRATLVEGDLKDLRASCSVNPVGEGSVVHLELELQTPMPVPGCLVAELEEHVLERWLDGLAAAS